MYLTDFELKFSLYSISQHYSIPQFAEELNDANAVTLIIYTKIIVLI